jgi:hypothetical protein
MRSPVRRALDSGGTAKRVDGYEEPIIIRRGLRTGTRAALALHVLDNFYLGFYFWFALLKEDSYWFVPPPIWAKIFKTKDLLARYGGIRT